MKRITANQYQTSERYYKLPKILFEDEKYMDMKLEVKVAYSIFISIYFSSSKRILGNL